MISFHGVLLAVTRLPLKKKCKQKFVDFKINQNYRKNSFSLNPFRSYKKDIHNEERGEFDESVTLIL